jgi:hypothetical protein
MEHMITMGIVEDGITRKSELYGMIQELILFAMLKDSE